MGWLPPRPCSWRAAAEPAGRTERYSARLEATWSTRTWLALQTQRMSIAVHFATAYQIARELDLAGPEDAAAFLGGGDADA